MATGSIEQLVRYEEVCYVESSWDDIAIRPTLFVSRIEWGDIASGTGRDFQ